ncbi:MAG: alpha/beta fold hydrolase [Acidimicrobiales bacterium]
MPRAELDHVTLSYDVTGEGDPVLLVCGTGQPAFSWGFDFAPRLVAAGYRVVTFDNRGVPPSDAPPPPYSVDDLAGDAAALIEHTGIGPCRVVGYSLGALVTQELALARPDLVRQAVMMGTVGRGNAMLRAWAQASLDLARSGAVLPPTYEAVSTVMTLMGPGHQRDDAFVGPWLELLALTPPWIGPGREGQYAADLGYDGRLDALGGVTVPSMVVGFEHDLITPATLCREVAAAIPGCRYEEVPGCGHLGPLEDPGAVVPLVVDFFSGR